MGAWHEFVSFVRGTRERPPPGPARPLAAALLVVAGLAHLPLVYGLVAVATLSTAFPLLVGILAMALAWAGGVTLEGRRGGTVRVLAAIGIAEGALAFLPAVTDALGSARWLFVGIALLSAAALVARR